MANNTALIAVKDRGRLDGFAPLWHKENHSLWGRWSWLGQVVIWTAIIDGLLAVVAFAESSQAGEPLEQTALSMYFLFATVFPAFGVIIFGQEDLLDERKLGTAAWVLSKPVSRAAFLLAKLCAQTMSVMGTRVLVPGFVAGIIFKEAGISLSLPGFLAGLGLVTLFVVFFLALNLMLGALFHARGPVIGIALAAFSSSYLPLLAPSLGKVLPCNLVMNWEPGQLSLAAALAQGQPLPSVLPILSTGLLLSLFIMVALVRFEREEF